MVKEEFMSNVESLELECPYCGHSQKAALWSSINVGLDPTMKDKLFRSEVNVHNCSGCGK